MTDEKKERTYSDEEIEARLKQDLPHWHLEGGWIRRKFRTHSWKGTLMVINTVGHLAEAGAGVADQPGAGFAGCLRKLRQGS